MVLALADIVKDWLAEDPQLREHFFVEDNTIHTPCGINVTRKQFRKLHPTDPNYFKDLKERLVYFHNEVCNTDHEI
jgi:hypothetical protein